MRRLLPWVLPFWICATALAAPDEVLLGRDLGYPVGRAAGSDWERNDGVRVGSFTHQAEIPGLYGGKANELAPAERPMPLRVAATEPAYRWGTGGERGLTVDDYLARQRVTGLLVIRGDEIQLERYQYERKPTDRFTSQSMAKSIVALAVGIGLGEGRIASLDDPAERYAPALRGTLYGGTAIRNLLRMGSGAKYLQTYDFSGDTRRFAAESGRHGIEAAARMVTERAHPQGTYFAYASPEASMLGAVVRGATGQTVSAYLTPRLWQAIGAQTSALWRADRTGLEVTQAHFNATLRDYGRLGIVLAHDGARPDMPGRQIIPREFLLDATDWRRVAEPFRPGKADGYWGYGYLFWLYPDRERRFAMLGSYGQAVLVDPRLRLVMVHTAVNATSEAHRTSLAREREALWRGVLAYHAKKP